MMPLLLPTLAIAIVCAALSIYSLRQKASLEQTENGDDALESRTDLTASRGETPDLRLAFHLQRRVGAFELDITWAPATRRLAIIGPSGSGNAPAFGLIPGRE